MSKVVLRLFQIQLSFDFDIPHSLTPYSLEVYKVMLVFPAHLLLEVHAHFSMSPLLLTQKNVDKAIVEEEKIDKELNTILEARAYPNPSNGIFTVDFGTYNVTKLIVFDMSGRAIYNETFSTKQDKVDLSLTNQKVGMYSIFMQTTQGVITKRIFIVN